MKRVKIFMFSFHRITGSIISLFFLMWFVSGLVLIYHSFPDVSLSDKYQHLDILPDSLPDINLILEQLPDSDKTVKKINLEYKQDQIVFSIKTKDTLYTICNGDNSSKKAITNQTIQNIATKWVDSPISKIDTLNEREIWIMYSRYEQDLPIYKLYFDDNQKHQLYISSRTGEVLQLTDKDQRFWAWVGAIPHKLYIPALRKNTDNWILTLTIGGIVAVLTSLSGLYVGVSVVYTRYKKKSKLGSPYTKRWYKWHHISGLIFGIFLITFAFSGAMAMQKIPQWIINTHGDYRISDSKMRGKHLSVSSYALDYRKIKRKYPDIKSVEWSHFRDTPIYNIVVGDKSMSIDASSSDVKELYLSQSEIEKAIINIHGQNTAYSVSFIDKYEEYYLSRKKNLPLPAYKVEVDNEDESRYYIDPKTGDFKYLNQSRKAKKWVFSGLHYLNIKYLMERPVLWTIAIWTLCVGGIMISFSGVYLSIKYFSRKIKYMKKIWKKK